MAAEYAGGCLCGAVRYRATAEPLVVTHCHCTLCQKESGAAFVTWAAFPKETFAFTEGTPGAYWATDKAERTFCSACGGTLTFVHVESADQVDVAAGSLDDPARSGPRTTSGLQPHPVGAHGRRPAAPPRRARGIGASRPPLPGKIGCFRGRADRILFFEVFLQIHHGHGASK